MMSGAELPMPKSSVTDGGATPAPCVKSLRVVAPPHLNLVFLWTRLRTRPHAPPFRLPRATSGSGAHVECGPPSAAVGALGGVTERYPPTGRQRHEEHRDQLIYFERGRRRFTSDIGPQRPHGG